MQTGRDFLYFCCLLKKIFSISLLIIFNISTIGVMASSYTCHMMQKKMRVNTCCDDKDCCTHEVKLIKVSDDFVSSPTLKISQTFSLIAVVPPVTETFSPHASFSLTNREAGHSPPLRTAERLSFIQSFLI